MFIGSTSSRGWPIGRQCAIALSVQDEAGQTVRSLPAPNSRSLVPRKTRTGYRKAAPPGRALSFPKHVLGGRLEKSRFSRSTEIFHLSAALAMTVASDRCVKPGTFVLANSLFAELHRSRPVSPFDGKRPGVAQSTRPASRKLHLKVALNNFLSWGCGGSWAADAP